MSTQLTATQREVATEGAGVRTTRRTIAVILLMLVLLPVYRLLDPQETGPAGSYTVGLLDIYSEFAWSGILLVLPIAIIAARMVSPEALSRASAGAGALLLRSRCGPFVLGCALIGSLLTAAFSLLVLEGKPNLIDAFAQMLQARYWAAGLLSGPADATAPFWGIQNALFTERGWVSQYPPGHVALIVPFLWLGAPWLLGPVLVFVTVVCMGLLAERLFAADPVIARLGTLLLALSPFFLFVSGSLMNHVTTAACTAAGAYSLHRAWTGRARWALIAGACLALSLATRPLSTLAMGMAIGALTMMLWRRPARHAAAVGAWGIIGAMPLLTLWFAYNSYFFGSPFRLGYDIALGPAMGLGFHRDPWGNRYGPVEALAYTSSDLITLGVNLFETPVSALLVIGLFLLTARRLPRSAWLLVGWAIAPVLANVLYWHHGLYMGPRMLHEAAPAWVMLFGVSAIGLVRRVPAQAALAGRYFARPALAATLVACFAISLVYLAPRRAASYGGSWISIARTPVPRPDGASIVFVHDAWNARLAMSLAARDMRLDLVETLIRQNPTCRVDEYVRAVVAGDDAAAAQMMGALDTVPRANRLPIPVELAPGDGMRVAAGEVLTGPCMQQALSDRFGIIDISPLLWQAELHGRAGDGPLIVRDLGPERNARLLARYPDRSAWLYVADHESADGVRLLPYGSGVRELWFPPDSVTLQLRRQVRPFEQ